MNFKNSLNNLKLDLTKLVIIPSGGTGGFEFEFDINSKDFLKYAKEDLHSGNDRGIINGITNAKRAIDCQIDEIMCRLGLDYQNMPISLETFVSYIEFKEDIPYKLKVVQGINLAPGLIISKFRNLRNKLEHLYQIPTIDEVKEAIDIAELFIRSMEGHYKSETNEFEITDKNNFIGGFNSRKVTNLNMIIETKS
jgi:hypothetical protein